MRALSPGGREASLLYACVGESLLHEGCWMGGVGDQLLGEGPPIRLRTILWVRRIHLCIYGHLSSQQGRRRMGSPGK